VLKLSLVSRGFQQSTTTLEHRRPDQSPAITEDALDAAAVGVQARIVGGYLHGPRPLRLDRITEKTIESVQIDRRQLPDAIQIGSTMLHLELAEFGRSGRRRRPAFQPALDDELARRMPDTFLHAWEQYARKGISGGGLSVPKVRAGAGTI